MQPFSRLHSIFIARDCALQCLLEIAQPLHVHCSTLRLSGLTKTSLVCPGRQCIPLILTADEVHKLRQARARRMPAIKQREGPGTYQAARNLALVRQPGCPSQCLSVYHDAKKVCLCWIVSSQVQGSVEWWQDIDCLPMRSANLLFDLAPRPSAFARSPKGIVL